MQDREIAYKQNLTGLEIAWGARIKGFASNAVEILLRKEYSDFDENPDKENLQMEAAVLVESKLFDSEQWAGVKATDISDIAYEAVGRIIDNR